MSEPEADSVVEPGEATGVARRDPPLRGTDAAADSTPEPEEAGQEQGEKSTDKRINGLMSLAQRRTAERDEALQQVEALQQQLAELSVEAPSEPVPSQDELMHPERYEQPDADGEAVDPMLPPEPPVIYMDPNNAMRPDQRRRSRPVPDSTSPAGRYAADRADIDALQAQLTRAGSEWYESQRELGLID